MDQQGAGGVNFVCNELLCHEIVAHYRQASGNSPNISHSIEELGMRLGETLVRAQVFSRTHCSNVFHTQLRARALSILCRRSG